MDPRNVHALHFLGVIARQIGKHGDAVALINQALAIKPDYAEALNNRGLALQELQRHEQALASYEQALAIKPNYAIAFYNRGNALRELERHEQALASYEQALAIKPDYAEAWSNRGNALRELRRHQEALASYERALAIKPDFAEALSNRGAVLRELERHEEALASCEQALAIRADFAEALSNRGVALQELLRHEEALASYEQALAIKPDLAEALSNRGNALKEMGRLDESEESYRQALALKPDFADAHSSLIFVLDLQPQCNVKDQQQERLRWYDAHGRIFAGPIKPHENVPDPERRLRVGYVSADFRRSSPYYAFGPVIALHDRAAFEVICYSGVKREDDATLRLRQAAHSWRSTLGLSDEALAEHIRRDRIDILVDLTGHMRGCRLLVFARKPAPIQVTAWGYANGTGLQTIDYFFADPIAVPKEHRSYFAEQVIDLPCILCYEAPEYMPQVSPLPSLGGKPFTYGCVNRVEKVSSRVLELWARILIASPGAKLLMKDGRLGNRGAQHAQKYFQARLAKYGVRADRIVLLGGSPHAEHLRIYHEMDLALDPFPQNGGISTAEALYMGVPVVTLRGQVTPSRVSTSILTALDMPEWIGESEEDYVRIALAMASDLPRLAQVRESLRTRVARSSLGDVRAYTRAVEIAYRSIWRHWCGRSRGSLADSPAPLPSGNFQS